MSASAVVLLASDSRQVNGQPNSQNGHKIFDEVDKKLALLMFSTYFAFLDIGHLDFTKIKIIFRLVRNNILNTVILKF